jgi:hypothetical protein
LAFSRFPSLFIHPFYQYINPQNLNRMRGLMAQNLGMGDDNDENDEDYEPYESGPRGARLFVISLREYLCL